MRKKQCLFPNQSPFLPETIIPSYHSSSCPVNYYYYYYFILITSQVSQLLNQQSAKTHNYSQFYRPSQTPPLSIIHLFHY